MPTASATGTVFFNDTILINTTPAPITGLPENQLDK
jgi:hypothetical protein